MDKRFCEDLKERMSLTLNQIGHVIITSDLACELWDDEKDVVEWAQSLKAEAFFSKRLGEIAIIKLHENAIDRYG